MAIAQREWVYGGVALAWAAELKLVSAQYVFFR